MPQKPREWQLYATAAGTSPVRREMDRLDEAAIGALEDLMDRYPAGDFLPREYENYGGGLHALKVTESGCEYRGYFTIPSEAHVFLLLQVTGKKARKAKLDLAMSRLKDWKAAQQKARKRLRKQQRRKKTR